MFCLEWIYFSPWERDVVDRGEDFLVSYHIVDPFHETNHISKTKVLSGQGIIDGGLCSLCQNFAYSVKIL